MRAIGYARVSTREQGNSGLGLEAQKRKIIAAAERDGFELDTVTVEVETATKQRRPVFDRVLEQLDAGEYGALIYTRLDRVARTLGGFAELMDRAKGNGWKIVMLEPAIDMTTPFGEAMAGMAAVFAQLERALIAQRTQEGLEVARERGTFRPGDHCRYGRRRALESNGTPAVDADGYAVVEDDRDAQATIRRIGRLVQAGHTYQAIAERLNAEGHGGPTGRGWHPRTVGRIASRLQP